MPNGIKKVKLVKVSVPAVAHAQLQILAAQEGQRVSVNIKNLIFRHLMSLGLPICFDPDAETETETGRD